MQDKHQQTAYSIKDTNLQSEILRNKQNINTFDSKTSNLQSVNRSETSRLDTDSVHQRVAHCGAYFGEIEGEVWSFNQSVCKLFNFFQKKKNLSKGTILISPNKVRLYEHF